MPQDYHIEVRMLDRILQEKIELVEYPMGGLDDEFSRFEKLNKG